MVWCTIHHSDTQFDAADARRPKHEEISHGQTWTKNQKSQPRQTPREQQNAQTTPSAREDLGDFHCAFTPSPTAGNIAVAAKDLILDPSEYDLNNVLADIDAIRELNPQRVEMEQLTAIVLDDPARNVCVGYKDITEDEFWVKGHMPGMPLMPGVIMCEAAAQVCAYHTQKHNLLGAAMVGFGGLDEVRFRGTVVPGDRLVIVAGLIKIRRGALIRSRFQAFVDGAMVCSGIIAGIPIPVEMLSNPA